MESGSENFEKGSLNEQKARIAKHELLSDAARNEIEVSLAKRWMEQRDKQALDELILRNRDKAKRIVRNWKYMSWARKHGLEDELLALSDLLVTEIAHEWIESGKVGEVEFGAFLTIRMNRALTDFFTRHYRQVPLEKTKKITRIVHALPRYCRSIGKMPQDLDEKDVEKAAEDLDTSVQTMRDALRYLSTVEISLDETITGEDDEDGKPREEPLSRPMEEPIGDNPYYFNPEQVLQHKQEEAQGNIRRKKKKPFDLEWARAQFREWLDLIPREERTTVMLRYLGPSKLDRSEIIKIREELPYASLAKQMGRMYRSDITKQQVRDWDKNAIARLKAFAQGDFSAVDPERVVEREKWRSLIRLRERAGENWDLWLLLLPNTEKQVLFRRWFYTKSDRSNLPRSFSNICQHEGEKQSRWKLKVSEQEARAQEDAALRHLQEFAEGDFSDADFRPLARMVLEKQPQWGEQFLRTLPRDSLEYMVFYYRLFKRKKVTLYHRNNREASAPMLSPGAKRFRDKISKLEGRDMSASDELKEEAKKRVEDMEKQLAARFIAFAHAQQRNA